MNDEPIIFEPVPYHGHFLKNKGSCFLVHSENEPQGIIVADVL